MCGKVRLIATEGRCDTCNKRVRKFGIIGAEKQLRRGDVKCDICRINPGTAVDHDHVTKLARGRLCKSCNVGLGSFRDDPTLLHRAANYLRRLKAIDSPVEAQRLEVA
jgi:Recombination endonuclease VII